MTFHNCRYRGTCADTGTDPEVIPLKSDWWTMALSILRMLIFVLTTSTVVSDYERDYTLTRFVS